jgi:hypothetical protein
VAVLQYPEFLDALRTQVPAAATVKHRRSSTAAGGGAAFAVTGDLATPGGQSAGVGATEGTR